MVASSICKAVSDTSLPASASSITSQTPRRNCRNTAFQSPNSAGRSRHGAPVRINQKMPSSVLRCRTRTPGSSLHKRLEKRPLLIRHRSPNHGRSPQRAALNHAFDSRGIARLSSLSTRPRRTFPWFESFSGGLIEFVGPSVNDGMAIDVVDGSQNPLLQFLFGGDADVPQDRAGKL